MNDDAFNAPRDDQTVAQNQIFFTSSNDRKIQSKDLSGSEWISSVDQPLFRALQLAYLFNAPPSDFPCNGWRPQHNVERTWDSDFFFFFFFQLSFRPNLFSCLGAGREAREEVLGTRLLSPVAKQLAYVERTSSPASTSRI